MGSAEEVSVGKKDVNMFNMDFRRSSLALFSSGLGFKAGCMRAVVSRRGLPLAVSEPPRSDSEVGDAALEPPADPESSWASCTTIVISFSFSFLPRWNEGNRSAEALLGRPRPLEEDLLDAMTSEPNCDEQNARNSTEPAQSLTLRDAGRTRRGQLEGLDPQCGFRSRTRIS